MALRPLYLVILALFSVLAKVLARCVNFFLVSVVFWFSLVFSPFFRGRFAHFSFCFFSGTNSCLSPLKMFGGGKGAAYERHSREAKG